MTDSKPSINVHQALDNAWRIHDAQGDWIAKVDSKASFAFGIESAGIASAIAIGTSGKLGPGFHEHWAGCFLVGGLAFLFVGMVFSAMVVVPQLRANAIKSDTESDFIYFGHARKLKPEDIERRLREEELLPQLSRQIVRTAEIAWMKHFRVKVSIWAALVGGLLLTIGFLISRFWS